MDTAYKIYANILNDKLKSEVEKKLKEGHFGFREAMDAVFFLSHVVNRELL